MGKNTIKITTIKRRIKNKSFKDCIKIQYRLLALGAYNVNIYSDKTGFMYKIDK